MELSDSDTIRSMPCITAFDAGKKKINASKAFSERQPAIPEARASSRVGCFLAGGRYPAMQDAGASIPNVESRGGDSPYFRSANSQQRCGPRGKTGLHVPAVCEGGVPAVLPTELEGINRGHIGADYQVASHTGVRQESASFNRSGSVAGFSRPESRGAVGQRSGAFALVSERNVQAGHVRWSDAQQSGGGVENSKKVSAGPGDAASDRRGGKHLPG